MQNLIKVIDALLIEIPSMSIRLFKDAGGTLSAEIPIGSKTGTGVLYEFEDSVILKTRYNEEDTILLDSIVKDISNVAWFWNRRYPDHGFSEEWLPVWLKEGKIKEKVVTKTEYVIQ